MNRRHRMIDTYCARMSFVSAPGCSSLRPLLVVTDISEAPKESRGSLRLSQGQDKLRSLIHPLQTFLNEDRSFRCSKPTKSVSP